MVRYAFPKEHSGYRVLEGARHMCVDGAGGHRENTGTWWGGSGLEIHLGGRAARSCQ